MQLQTIGVGMFGVIANTHLRLVRDQSLAIVCYGGAVTGLVVFVERVFDWKQALPFNV
jgi:hypothetical protein